MFEKEITKQSYKFLCLLYKEYLQRCNTMSCISASVFNYVPVSIHEHISKEDCRQCLIELNDNDLVKLYVDGGFRLSSTAIVHMENRFKKDISSVVSFIASIIKDCCT